MRSRYDQTEEGYPADNVEDPRGRSSVGRALAWHARGSWVRGPSPPLSVADSPPSAIADLITLVGFTLAGVVAGEGSFSVTRKLPPHADGDARLRFVFGVTMADRDRPLLEVLRAFLGFGSIRDGGPGQKGMLPVSTFVVNSLRAHHQATIPFAERFLLPCAKRDQFERWRDAMSEYEAVHPSRWGKGRSVCSRPGCDKAVRGRGVCRSHYYEVTGY